LGWPDKLGKAEYGLFNHQGAIEGLLCFQYVLYQILSYKQCASKLGRSLKGDAWIVTADTNSIIVHVSLVSLKLVAITDSKTTCLCFPSLLPIVTTLTS